MFTFYAYFFDILAMNVIDRAVMRAPRKMMPEPMQLVVIFSKKITLFPCFILKRSIILIFSSSFLFDAAFNIFQYQVPRANIK